MVMHRIVVMLMPVVTGVTALSCVSTFPSEGSNGIEP